MSRDDATDALVAAGQELAVAVRRSWQPWVESIVWGRARGLADAEVIQQVCDATAEAVDADVGESLSTLMEQVPEEQRQTPLEVCREAAKYVGAALGALGVEPPSSSATSAPDRGAEGDDYDIGPASFRELGTEAFDASLRWAAAVVVARSG